jgi:hypothetical protein
MLKDSDGKNPDMQIYSKPYRSGGNFSVATVLQW